MQAIIIMNGTAEEIAALALAVQERRDISEDFAEKFHQQLKDRLEEGQAHQASH